MSHAEVKNPCLYNIFIKSNKRNKKVCEVNSVTFWLIFPLI